jgi:hypothetical protein
MFRWLLDNRVMEDGGQPRAAALEETEQKMLMLLRAIKHFTGGTRDETAIAQATRRELEFLLRLPVLASRSFRSRKYQAAINYLQISLDDLSLWGTLLGWLCVHSLGQIVDGADVEQSRSWIDEWLLGKIIATTLRDLGLDEAAAWQAVTVIKLLVNHQGWPQAPNSKLAYPTLSSWLKDDEVRQFIQVNLYNGIAWFNKEAFEQLLRWMFLLAVVKIGAGTYRSAAQVTKEIVAYYGTVEKLHQAEEASQYQVENLLAAAHRLDAPRPRVRGPRTSMPRRRTRAR